MFSLKGIHYLSKPRHVLGRLLTESLGHLPTTTSYYGSKFLQTGRRTQSQPLRNAARSICKMLANRMTHSEHGIIKAEKALLDYQVHH